MGQARFWGKKKKKKRGKKKKKKRNGKERRIRGKTIEISLYFHHNPYKMPSLIFNTLMIY